MVPCDNEDDSLGCVLRVFAVVGQLLSSSQTIVALNCMQSVLQHNAYTCTTDNRTHRSCLIETVLLH